MGFIPSGDKIQSIFTNTIPAYSSLVRLDLFASYEMANALFRSYKDRVFGVATANAVSQISPNDSIFRFGINPNADSVVMRIKYKVIYVNKASAVYFKVYQLQNLYTSTDSIKYWDLIPGKEHS